MAKSAAKICHPYGKKKWNGIPPSQHIHNLNPNNLKLEISYTKLCSLEDNRDECIFDIGKWYDFVKQDAKVFIPKKKHFKRG